MNATARYAILVICATLSACQMTAAQMARAAVLSNPGTEVKLELSQAIMTMTGFSSVALADQDLTRSSELVVERKHHKTANGELIQGRDLEPPQRFQLVTQHGQCWLVHQSSGQRMLLKKAQCRADDKTG